MGEVRAQVLEIVRRSCNGITEADIAFAIYGRRGTQPYVNPHCRKLLADGLIVTDDGRPRRYWLPEASAATVDHSAASELPTVEPQEPVAFLSNAVVGRLFEDRVQAWLAGEGLALARDFRVPIGVGNKRSEKRFDLGSTAPAVLVECKAHTWTVSGNNPGAKLTVWNEAMYYFHLAPSEFRKLFVVRRSMKGAMSLLERYLDWHAHLVPGDVEIWEFDDEAGLARRADL